MWEPHSAYLAYLLELSFKETESEATDCEATQLAYTELEMSSTQVGLMRRASVRGRKNAVDPARRLLCVESAAVAYWAVLNI